MINTNIAMEFLKQLRSRPTWSEIAYAFDNQIIPMKTVIDYASDKLAVDQETNHDELSIASASVSDSIAGFVHDLARSEGDATESDARLYWANIMLTWVYEHRTSFDDLLDVVEKIYTDFDYPAELAPFVRYMPSQAPDLGSRKANEERMIASIGEYVRQFTSV